MVVFKSVLRLNTYFFFQVFLFTSTTTVFLDLHSSIFSFSPRNAWVPEETNRLEKSIMGVSRQILLVLAVAMALTLAVAVGLALAMAMALTLAVATEHTGAGFSFCEVTS